MVVGGMIGFVYGSAFTEYEKKDATLSELMEGGIRSTLDGILWPVTLPMLVLSLAGKKLGQHWKKKNKKTK